MNNWKSPRDVKVGEWLYPDRGMLKWQGYLLSEHNEAIFYEAWEELNAPSFYDVSEEEKESWNDLLVVGNKLEVKVHRFLEPDEVFRGTLVHVDHDFFVLSQGSERIEIYFDEVYQVRG
ncbi:hypothetical protein [Guggenheimella bovis]